MVLSIIIPVYNKSRYLDGLFRCLRAQSFADYECLVVNDGSTDNSGALCRAFAQEDDRIRVIDTENRGVSHARNMGLDMARGEYITFIDADDAFHPDYLKNLVECMERSGADLVISSFSRIWDNSRDVLPVEPPFPPGTYSMEKLLPDFAATQKRTGSYGWCWAKLLKRELIGATRFTEGLGLAEDLDFYIKLYPKMQRVCFDDKPYYYYRQGAENGSVVMDDYAIDYAAQLGVWLRCREFMQTAGVWEGENQRIVLEQLSNYAYFTLFYCDLSEFSDKFDDLERRLTGMSYPCSIGPLRQRYLLHCLKGGQKGPARAFLRVFRRVRKMVRRG